MFKGLKGIIKDKSEEKFEEYTPKIQSLLRDKVGPNVRQALENDEIMKTALKEVHGLLILTHPYLRPFLSQDRFVRIG
jgi:hypothetical protein